MKHRNEPRGGSQSQDQMLEAEGFNPFDRDAGRELTEDDVKLLSGQPEPLTVLIPVVIEENKEKEMNLYENREYCLIALRGCAEAPESQLDKKFQLEASELLNVVSDATPTKEVADFLDKVAEACFYGCGSPFMMTLCNVYQHKPVIVNTSLGEGDEKEDQVLDVGAVPFQQMLSVMMKQESDGRKLDVLFGWADDMYHTGRFQEVDDAIKELDLSDLSSTVIVGWLTITHWARPQLKNRPEFVRRAREAIRKIKGPFFNIDKMLQGLGE